MYNPKDLKECYDIIEKGSHSFYAASKVLPKKIRDSAIVLYSFCRIVDDSIDETTSKDKALKELFKRLDAVYEERPGDNPSDRCFSILVKFYEMPKQLPLALLEGMDWDTREKEYKTLSELRAYCARVASTVGVMMCILMRVRDKDILARACDLGVAMQLTNIARDVVEDKKMNREYIKPDFENIKATLKLAEMFYESSFSSIQKIPFKYKFTIIVARRIYRQIGRKILQKNNMDNYEKSGKIYVNNFEKTYQTIISIFDLILIYLKEIEPHQRAEEHTIISQEVDLDERI